MSTLSEHFAAAFKTWQAEREELIANAKTDAEKQAIGFESFQQAVAAMAYDFMTSKAAEQK